MKIHCINCSLDTMLSCRWLFCPTQSQCLSSVWNHRDLRNIENGLIVLQFSKWIFIFELWNKFYGFNFTTIPIFLCNTYELRKPEIVSLCHNNEISQPALKCNRNIISCFFLINEMVDGSLQKLHLVNNISDNTPIHVINTLQR